MWSKTTNTECASLTTCKFMQTVTCFWRFSKNYEIARSLKWKSQKYSRWRHPYYQLRLFQGNPSSQWPSEMHKKMSSEVQLIGDEGLYRWKRWGVLDGIFYYYKNLQRKRSSHHFWVYISSWDPEGNDDTTEKEL